jgi:flagellar hook assembly protein FlgD
VQRIALKLTGESELPKEFALMQNYPNPFNPSTTIKYDLPVDSHVALKVFNILGQEVVTLANGEQKAGYRSVEWNANGVASGVYFYRLEAGNFTSMKKLLLLK